KRMQLLASHSVGKRVVIMDGTTTYRPSLLQKAKEWDNESVSVMSSGERSDTNVGIYTLSGDTLRHIAGSNGATATTLQQLLTAPAETYSVVRIAVAEDSWQVVHTEKDRLAAEGKLNHWLVKPTDGVFARLNRRVSIPISRQLIRFPVTA